MADILTHVFRTFIQHNGKTKDFKIIAPSKCSTLVVGDCSVNRSLLLLAAVTAASELGLKVSFFTQVQIQSLPGSLHESMSNLSPDNLKKITFSYPRSLEDLLQDVASLHESASGSAAPPSLIIVDGLEGYLRGPGTLEERAASLAPCRVIASFQSEWEGHAGGDSSDPVLSVLDRYFQVRCTLDQDWNSAPAVAGPQDTWHVYLSGAGITEDPIAKDEEDSSLAQEWRLVICPNRSMEFTMV
ncbi:uncharacterized protein LOC118365514 isoform X2 [Oncorhynchus keta]|uniref:uncharacterized protein LOC118365514 isoform X2 n=1 Tax=Oncorhynchus keta TaxID=8018 RepID=UPI0015FCC3A2|nr:uncharacterized protein LOC118365514 isoform X2 [Oncorhynchus keta]